MENNTTIYEDISKAIRENSDFKLAYEQLIKEVALFSLNLDNTNRLLEVDVKRKLIESAAIFSLSNDSDKAYALKILNGLFVCNNSEFHSAIKLLLIRLGNFPTANQLGSFEYNNKDIKELDLGLRSEFLSKYLNNKLDEKIMLTDFQADLIGNLRQQHSVSFSAPTSAGKSFILKQYVAQLFLQKEVLNVCFIVPTKALITQTYLDFLGEFEKLEIGKNIKILTTTTQLEVEFEKKDTKRRLLILTQERLQYFLYFSKTDSIIIDVLVIDEAQKIGDSARGVLLESVLLEAIKRNGNMQVICSSPLASNPEILFNLLNCERNIVIKSSFSPVPQYIYDVSMSGKNIVVNLISDNKIIELKREIPVVVKPIGVYATIAFFAYSFGKGQLNIVFANGPSAAEKIAAEICGHLQISASTDIEEFITFVKDEIHPLYNLADVLKYGVAYHYSDMPLFVKKRIEELYKDQHINFLCCTSTLLEGVNLPARNIFVYRPQEGLGNNMSESSFWNLVGRAGRLTYELVGNVFCIDTNKWPVKLFESDKEYRIVSSTEEVLKQNADNLMSYLIDPSVKETGDLELYERATALFIRNRIENNDQTVTRLMERRKVEGVNYETLVELDVLIAKEISKITIPLEILNRNSSIDPRKQQELYEFLLENKDNFDKLIPLHPNSPYFYKRLYFALSIADQMAGIHNERYKYYTYFASRWIKEKTLREIISEKIDYHCSKNNCMEKRENPEFVNKTIQEVFEDINDKMSFHYARMVQCYVDLIEHVSKEIGYGGSLDLSLPLYLEYGVYRNTSLYIISIGGSRSLAIRLSNKYNSCGNGSLDDFKDWILKNKSYIIDELLPRSLQEEFLNITLNSN